SEIKEILNIWTTNNYYEKFFKKADINNLESDTSVMAHTNTMSEYQSINYSDSSDLKNLIDIPKVNLDKIRSIASQESD
ncbi:14439_t:CDS:1, partial [Cetraspora pellucida]